MSNTFIKKKKDLFKKIDNLFNKTPDIFINWLKDIPTNYSEEKIPSLFNSSTKIKVETTSPDGQYNLILLWIIENKDKFKPYTKVLNDIPSSNFTIIEDIIKTIQNDSTIVSYELDIEEAIKKWKENPNIDPFNGKTIKTSIVPTSEYGKLYEKFCNHLSKYIYEENIRNRTEIYTSHTNIVLIPIDTINKISAFWFGSVNI